MGGAFDRLVRVDQGIVMPRRYGRAARFAAAASVMAFAGLATSSARTDDADTQAKIEKLEEQVRQLQSAIDTIRREEAQKWTPGQQPQQYPAAPPSTIPNRRATAYETPQHQFGIQSEDGQNSIELTGRLQLDAGDYLMYHHEAGLTTPTRLDSGFNARRARLGVTGRFAGDFNYSLVYDFGGNDDSVSPFVSGSATSGIENALITYNGFNKPDYLVPVAFDVGYMSVPWTLQQATSSDDLLFLERASSQQVATEFGAGDYRSVADVRSYDARYWAAAFVSGPTSGAPHSAPAGAVSGTSLPVTSAPSGEPLAFLARASYQVLQQPDYSLHVGVNAAHTEKSGTASTTLAGGTVTPAESLTLSDRPELRVDPTSLLSATITNFKNANVGGVELAGAYGSGFIQAEGYHYMVDRFSNTAASPHPDLDFDGGYVEASYAIGGKRNYIPATGAYSGVIPDRNLSLTQGGGWGAVEFALRFSEINLNDKGSAKLGGIEGGNQQVYGVGINYYPNLNVKFMLDFLHTDISRFVNTAGASYGRPNGASVNAVAGRFQFVF